MRPSRRSLIRTIGILGLSIPLESLVLSCGRTPITDRIQSTPSSTPESPTLVPRFPITPATTLPSPVPTPIFGQRADAAFSPEGSVPFSSRATSPDGTKFARELEPRGTGKVGIFAEATEQLLRTLDFHQTNNDLKGLAWSPDSKHVAVMFHFGGGGSIYVADVETGKQVASLPVSENFHYIVFSRPGTQIIASLKGDGTGIETLDIPASTNVATSTPVPPPSGPTARIQKGMNVTGWNVSDFSSSASDQSLRRLAGTGAQWIALVVPGFQDTFSSTTIRWQFPRTPSDDDLAHAISTAHTLGLRVMLKPQLGFATDNAHWRGDIGTAFPNEAAWQAWFASYTDAMVHYAQLARSQRVEQYCVGTELSGVSGREQSWRDIVRRVRGQFTGPVVYASNYGEGANIHWWDALDYIGVDAYYALSDSVTPTVAELKQAWIQKEYVTLLQSLSSRFGKPILFTEIGYRSVDRSAQAPWSYPAGTPANPQAQANAYQAAIETFADKPWFAGFYWWNWPTNLYQGGPLDTDYVPVGKPAEKVLSRFYSQTQ